MVSKMMCVIVYGFHVTQKDILGFQAPSTIFRGFRERILCVRVLIGFVDYFIFCVLFLGFTNVFNGLVRLDSEWSAQFQRLAVRGEEEREFCVQGLHGFAWRYYGLGLTVEGLPGDLCLFQGLYVAQREILGFCAPDIGFQCFQREKYVRTCKHEID